MWLIVPGAEIDGPNVDVVFHAGEAVGFPETLPCGGPMIALDRAVGQIGPAFDQIAGRVIDDDDARSQLVPDDQIHRYQGSRSLMRQHIARVPEGVSDAGKVDL